MKTLTLEDRFATTLERFEALLLSEELYPRLEEAMPGIARIEPLERSDDGARVQRRVRYTPNVEGKIPAFGRGVVQPEMLSWIEASTYDRAQHRFVYQIIPNLPPSWRDRFDARGTYQLTERGGEVVRVIEATLAVRVPIFGGTVEKMIAREVGENFRAEAEALRRLFDVRR